MIAISTVHTSGINWESISVILGGFAGFAGLVLTIVGRISRSLKDEITESVNHLAEILNERLATKEAVSQLEKEVAVLQERDSYRRR